MVYNQKFTLKTSSHLTKNIKYSTISEKANFCIDKINIFSLTY